MDKKSLLVFFEEQYGSPNYNFEVSIEGLQESFYIVGLKPLPDENNFDTIICTLGLSLFFENNMEFFLRFTGDFSSKTIEILGKGLLLLVRNIYSSKQNVEPYHTVQVPDLNLPIYPNFKNLLIVDWFLDGPSYLDEENEAIRCYQLIPISKEEALVFNNISMANREAIFNLACDGWNNPTREKVDFYFGAIKTLWEKIEKWYTENSPLLAGNLRPGLLEDEIVSLENQLELTLPQDIRNSLKIHNGDMYFDSYKYLTADEMLGIRQNLNELLQEGSFKTYSPVYPAKDILQNAWWDKNWIPFASDSGGNLICVDMNHGEKGKYGQVLFWEKHEGPIYSGYSSFFEWLRNYLNKLWRDEYSIDNEGFLTER